LAIHIDQDLALDDREIDERFVRASGPGGQNVNKVATAVQLRFNVFQSSLPDAVKLRLVRLARSRLTDEGVLVIDSRVHRTQAQNREAARERLIELIKKAAATPKARHKTSPSKTAREKRLTLKKRRSNLKSLRRRGVDD
jgi:ribosome-associated protein